MSTALPLADHRDVRRWVLSVVADNRREFASMMALFGLATIVFGVSKSLWLSVAALRCWAARTC